METTIEKTVKTKLQNRFMLDNLMWQILERKSGLVLIRGNEAQHVNSQFFGGKTRFDVCAVVLNEFGGEYVKLSWGIQPPQIGKTEEESDWRWSEKMARLHFQKCLDYSEQRKQEKLQEAETKKDNLQTATMWEELVRDARAEQSKLINELKTLSRHATYKEIIESKETTKILDKLSRLEQVMHHGKPKYQI